MEFCKYEFTDLQWSSLKKKIEITNENENTSFVGCSVVELGHIVTTPAIMDGMVIKTNAGLSLKFCVDILWNETPLAEFDKFEVYPAPCGIHTFGGFEGQYSEKYYNKYPEFKTIEKI